MPITVSHNPGDAITSIHNAIRQAHDSSSAILLLLPGGSAAHLIEPILRSLTPYEDSITISLTDERYVDPSSSDSNWHVIASCKYLLPNARFVPVLTGESRDATTGVFARLLDGEVSKGSTLIGLFGIGTDGHTAGIKPGTVAVDIPTYAASFTGNDFERITITPKLIAKLSHATLYASGQDKTQVISEFMSTDVDIHTMPAQCLKRVESLTVVHVH